MLNILLVKIKARPMEGLGSAKRIHSIELNKLRINKFLFSSGEIQS